MASIPATQFDSNACKRVVLIHGLAAHYVHLWPMAWYLNRKGFDVSIFGYRSWFWSIERHAERFAEELDRLEQDPNVESFAVVAHSMGGIVTRQAILGSDSTESSPRTFSKLKRVVLLGPPNQGSPKARRFGFFFPFCKTVRQLSDRPGSFVRDLPPPTEVEIGVIAAQRDRVVPATSSQLPTAKDHVSVSSGHNGLLFRPSVLKQVIEFLTKGRFSR